MKLHRKLLIVLMLLLALFSLAACGGSDDETPEGNAEATEEVSSPDESNNDEATEDESTEDESTEGETTEDEKAEDEKAEVQVKALNTNINLRSGPGTNYSVIGTLNAGSELTVTGRNEDSSWVVGTDENGEEVWVIADPSLVEVDQAMVAKLPVIEPKAAAPAFNASNPQVNRILNEIPFVVHHGDNYTCASNGGLNHLLPGVVDGHVIGPHAGDLVLDNDNVLFKRSGGSFVLIRENPTARFEGGAETLSMTQAMQLVEAGRITWTGDFGQGGRGVPGCDPRVP